MQGQFTRRALSLLLCLLLSVVWMGGVSAQAQEASPEDSMAGINWKETDDEGVLPPPVEVPILMYHNLVAEENDPSISTDTLWVGQFRRQMELLRENGFTAISFEELIAFAEEGESLPEKPVLLTFDDGYRSAYELVFPILREFEMKATMFPIGVSVGKDTYKSTGYAMIPHFSWEEAKEMVDSGLVSIQSHTYDMHQWEPFELASLGVCLRPNLLRQDWETEEEYAKALHSDLNRSRKGIEEGTGESVTVLSYPGGCYDQLSEELLASYGIKCTLTIQPGKAEIRPGEPESLYGLNRFYVTPSTTEEEFLSWVL